jgi:hypothetical protein
LKNGLLVAVIAAILFVLISPLPELDAAGTIRSTIIPFVLVLSWALLLGSLSSTLSPPALSLSSEHGDILKKNCARLC